MSTARCASAISAASTCSGSSTPASCARTSWRCELGWDRVHRRCASRSRSTTASHPRSRPVISCSGARTSTARSTCWRCCAREAAEPRPAHAHALRRGLRHVAVRRGVAVGGDRHQLPAAARRARRAPGQGHALDHAGARRPARGAGRARALPDVPARGPARVARARPARRAVRGARVLGRALRSGRRRARAPRRPDRRVRPARDAGRAPPPTPCSRCWPPTPACGSSWRPGSRRTGAASAPGTAASGCPSARTRRGSTSCSRRPACTSRASNGPAPGPFRSEAGVVLVPTRPRGDRPRLAHVRLSVARRLSRHASADAARPPGVGQRRHALRPRARRRAGARATPSEFVDALDGHSVVAFDTELFGHFWHEGPIWLERVLELAEVVPVPAGRLGARAGHARRRAGAAGRDLRTWSTPSLAWTQRSAELAALGAAPSDRGAARAAGAAELRLGVPDH